MKSKRINDKIIAKQCLEFKGCRCDNKECLNDECPLHKSIPGHINEIKRRKE